MDYRDPRHPVEVDWDARYAALRRTGVRLDAVLTAGVREGKRMSRVSMVGGAMTALKAKLERRATDLMDRIEAVDRAGDEKFSLADHHLSSYEADLAEMESELRQLGNFPPLAGSDVKS